jgi:hypothetical protein
MTPNAQCELCKGTGKVRVLNEWEGAEDEEGKVIYVSQVYTEQQDATVHPVSPLLSTPTPSRVQ